MTMSFDPFRLISDEIADEAKKTRERREKLMLETKVKKAFDERTAASDKVIKDLHSKMRALMAEERFVPHVHDEVMVSGSDSTAMAKMLMASMKIPPEMSASLSVKPRMEDPGKKSTEFLLGYLKFLEDQHGDALIEAVERFLVFKGYELGDHDGGDTGKS